MKIKIVNEDNVLLLEVNTNNFKKDEVVILNLNNTVKDIAIGFGNYLADNKINRSVIVIDGISNNAWFDNNKAKYTNIDSIFNEYLNTLK